MSKFYAAGLRRLADALDTDPIGGDLFADQTPTFQVNVGHYHDVIAAAARFNVPVMLRPDGANVARVDFDGVELVIYAGAPK